MKGLKKVLHANNNQKRAGVATLSSEETEFKSKLLQEAKDYIIYWYRCQPTKKIQHIL